MKILKISLIIIIISTLSACATTQNYQRIMSSWHGANINKLVDSWGYPKKQFKIANGNRVYMYRRKYKNTVAPTHTDPYITKEKHDGTETTTYHPGTYTPGYTTVEICTTWFEFNRHNIIVRTRFAGNDCVATKYDIKKKGNPDYLMEP